MIEEVFADNPILAQKIREHCTQNRKVESCGLIIDTNCGFDVFPCRNVSPQPSTGFVLNHIDYYLASLKGSVQAVYHSHIKTPEFSELDVMVSNSQKLPFILYFLPKKSFFFYEPGNFIPEYTALDFEIGIRDCFSLARKYFKNKFNIDIPDIPRNSKWKQEDPQKILKHYKKIGFVEQDVLKKDDALLINYSIDEKNPTHIAIYQGDNVILHHPYNRKSCFSIYTEEQKRRTTHIVRHKSLC